MCLINEYRFTSKFLCLRPVGDAVRAGNGAARTGLFRRDRRRLWAFFILQRDAATQWKFQLSRFRSCVSNSMFLMCFLFGSPSVASKSAAPSRMWMRRSQVSRRRLGEHVPECFARRGKSSRQGSINDASYPMNYIHRTCRSVYVRSWQWSAVLSVVWKQTIA